MNPDRDTGAFGIDRAVEGRWTRLRVRGELDLATAPRVTEAAGAEFECGHRVVLDLCGVRFMDSTGIGMLIGSVRVAQSAGLELAISSDLHEQVRRVLDLTGVADHLPWISPAEIGS